MLVSVVIPAHNAAGTLPKCVKACLNQTYTQVEVIVVDDGSEDDTPQAAQSFPIRYIRQDQAGPAAARNRGAREARGDLVAFTDADCIPEPDWVERLVEGFTRDGIVGVGGTYGIANPDNLLARIVHEEIMARHARFGDEVDFLGSFNVAYRRSAFEAVGGFDEAFSAPSAEDNDLAYRLADAGGAFRFMRAARVAHHHPTRLGSYLRTQMSHGFWRMTLNARHPGRARRGARYAAGAELAAPVLALLIALGLAAMPLAALSETALMVTAAATLVLLSVFVLIYLRLVGRMVRSSRDLRMLLFLDVVLLRDAARGIGMIRGVWWFMVRRKATA